MQPVGTLARALLLWCLLGLAACAWGAAGRLAVGGVLDLRGWDGREEAALDGQWAVAWRSLPPGAAPAAFIQVPQLWNDLPGARAGTGMAVYSLRLYLPATRPALTLRIPQILSASRVWLDGREVLATGRVAAAGQDEQPRILTRFVPVPAGRDVLDLRIEVSNHFHVEGGIGNRLAIGESEAMARDFDRPRLLYAGVICTLLLLAVYTALFARHTPATQRGALIVLLLDLAVRLLCTSELLKLVFPDISEKLALHLEYAVIYIWPAYFYLLRAFFPSCTHRWVGVVLTVLGAIGLVGTVVLPTPVLTSFRDLTSTVLILSALYYIVCIARAIHRRLPGAALLGIGLLFALTAAVHDALMYAHFFRGTDIAPVGILLFMFAHFVELGRRVGQSLADVRRLSSELSLVNAGLEYQVEQRTREIRTALDELTEAKNRAEAEARVKSLFLANISHEVRTPVNLILGMARLLRDAVQGEHARRYLALMDRSGKNLVSLLDDILDLSRLESGKATLALQPTDLRDFFQEVADMTRFLCEDKGLRFVSRIGPLDAPVLVDPLKLRQVLVNLIGNAVKFTESGEVALEARSEATPTGVRLECAVSDTGPGISPAGREHVFDVFGRDARTTHIQGSGLGLAIVRRLVGLMQGAIALEDGPAGGACFRLTFTLAQAAAPAPVPPVPATLPPPGRLRILLVEDTPENRLLIQEYLRPAGHALQLAESGREALAWLERATFDLVLLDMRLGDMHGEDVARVIRRHARPEVAYLPIIAITANVSAADRQGYDEVGVDEVVPKPIDLEALLDALARHAPAGTGQVDAAAAVSTVATTADAARRAFDDACRTCLAALEQLEARPAGAEQAEAMLRMTHRLRGGAASFGQVQLAVLAETLEAVLTARQASAEPQRALQDALRAYLDPINS